MGLFRGFFIAVARPATRNRLVGERLNGKPVFTSTLRTVFSWSGLALVQTQPSGCPVVLPAAPSPEAALRAR